MEINGIHNGNKKLCFQTNAEHGQARRRKQCLYRVNQCCQNLTTFHFCLGREEGGGGKLFTLDQKWNWKLHISSLSRKLGHRLAVFHHILHVLDK